MRPKHHILIGFIVSIILYFFFSIGFLGATLIFLSSVLIDFDHYLYYIFRTKNFDLKKAYYWYIEKEKELKKYSKEERKKIYYAFYIFHGLEWVLIFVLLGYFLWNLFYFIAAGMFLHLLTDWTENIIHRKRIFKISIIADLIERKNLKKI
jgi:hypothetical protein